MSDTDSFIEEVTEEVRRDQLYATLRKYGWIGIALVVLVVGGTAWNEYTKAQARDKAQSAGDAIVAALEAQAPEDRIAALAEIKDGDFTPGAKAIVGLLKASEQSAQGDVGAAQSVLDDIAADGALPEIYRQIAAFKSASRAGDLTPDERRVRLEALAAPGQALRVLATEQLALIDIEEGSTDAALEKLQSIVIDAEATAGLRQRASQLIIALGEEPQRVPGLADAVSDDE